MRGVGRADVLLHVKCPTTKQMRPPVNAYVFFCRAKRSWRRFGPIFTNTPRKPFSFSNSFRWFSASARLFPELPGMSTCGWLSAGRRCFKSARGIWASASVDELEQTRPPLEVLAAVCRRVFRTVAQPGESDRSGEPGIWLFTGMEDFSCRQCGHCCRNLDYYDQLTEADYNRWQALGRTDILKKVRRVKLANNTFAYRMWERTGTGKTVSPCPWLHKIPTQNRWECRIHDVRPEICRQYPGSRKHAEMTGCPGVQTP